MNVKIEDKKKKLIYNPKITMIIALALIWIVFAFTTNGSFLHTRNLSNLFRQMTVTGILAIGMVYIIVIGEIDLSVGSFIGLMGGIVAILNVRLGINTPVVIIITLIIGVIIGLWNGYWVAYKRVPSFIATLSSMLIFRGILIGICNGQTIAGLSKDFTIIGQGYINNMISIVLSVLVTIGIIYSILSNRKSKIKNGLPYDKIIVDILKIVISVILILIFMIIMNSYRGIPTPVLILLILSIIFSYISNQTVLGRRIYAIGGNMEAAKLSGINVKLTKLISYAIMGFLAASAGILLTARLDAATVAAGQNGELDAIAACVIGGSSMSGGVGSVYGAIIGALVMASIDNGMSMLNMQPFWQYIVKGAVLLLAVWLDVAYKKKK